MRPPRWPRELLVQLRGRWERPDLASALAGSVGAAAGSAPGDASTALSLLHPGVALPVMPHLEAEGWGRGLYRIYLAFQSRKDDFNKPEWIQVPSQMQRLAGEVRGWRGLCEPPNASSPLCHHPPPTSLCKVKFSRFQPKMNPLASARAASTAERAAFVSWLPQDPFLQKPA